MLEKTEHPTVCSLILKWSHHKQKEQAVQFFRLRATFTAATQEIQTLLTALFQLINHLKKLLLDIFNFIRFPNVLHSKYVL